MENLKVKKAYLQDRAGQLQQWDIEIDKLKARASNSQAEAKTELLHQIDELLTMKKTALGKLKQLQDEGDDAWEDVKEGVEKSWKKLHSAFSKASSRFEIAETTS